ncbi:MAG: T9SS type A sorting domain-containing protein [Bacteroidetes bacterium]|nr:T9SS type A sorting domain-containing protein [Bacteroidota bacterium]
MKQISLKILVLFMLAFSMVAISTQVQAQCQNASPYGTQTAPALVGGTATIGCQYASEYGTWNAVVAGNTYRMTSTVGTDFCTVRSLSPGGAVVAFGVQPLTFTAPVSGTYYIHWNTNNLCGTQNTCRDVTMTLLAPPPTISSFSPTSGCGASASVVITGTNFTGATAVSFGGIPAQSFVVNNATQITAVPSVGNTGTISVTTLGGTGTSAGTFTVTTPPTVTVTASTNPICSGSSTTLTAVGVNMGAGAVDQSQLVNNTCMATFAQTGLAQSFVPSVSSMCGAGVFLVSNAAGSGTVTIELYTNLPNAAGVLLATGSAVATDGTWADVTWPSVPVTIGTTYYLVLTSTNNSHCVAGDISGGYANGQLYANAGYNPFPNYDYTFRTYSCGGGSYLYNPGALSGAIQTVSPAAATVYTVTATAANGCTNTSSISISVTPVAVAPNPVTATPSTICGTGTSQLNSTSIANAIQTWYTVPSGGVAIGTSLSGANFPVTPAVTTTYYVETFENIPSGSQTFNYTGGLQTFTVPAGITSITVDAFGAQGAGNGISVGGLGGNIQTTLAVTGGQVLNVYVGGQGTPGPSAAGGYNGGGASSNTTFTGSGGGASDVRVAPYALANRLVVAGGGGGAGYNCASNMEMGGAGGGLIGADGWQCGQQVSYVGTGGSQVAGGLAGNNQGQGCGQNGSLGLGGNGACTYGGGGGGGYYGGGGGGYGGGGGGSSYSSGPILVNTQGVRSGNGQVIISWTGSVTCPSNPRVPVTVTVSSPTVTASASVNPLCEGSSTILTGGGAVSYIWTGGVTDGVSFAPLATNTYTVTGTDGVGCTATSSITVTVNPLSPTPSPVTATPSVICVGGNSDLNAVSVGNTINWYTVPSGGVAIGTVPSGTNLNVTPAVTTTYYAETQGGAPGGSQTFNYTGSIQTFTVPAGVTSITMEARGAQGGSINVNCVASGGLGARMIGDVAVTPGEVISVLVGQQGFTNGADAGGGGGSFVVRTGNIPLVVAGGGGGASNNIGNCGVNLAGGPGLTTLDGGASGSGMVAGGINGNGGGANFGSGGGGGGFFTDGIAGSGLANNNGKSYLNGGIGGTGNNNDFGGYGGGGAGWFTGGNGGGGGGYSGGGTDGNYPTVQFAGGGGGGSYNIGANQSNTAGFQSGNGLVIFTWSGAASCPSVRVPVTVTVDPIPVISVSASSNPICEGDATTLTASGLIASGTDQSQLISNTCMANFNQTDLAQSFIPSSNTICGAGVYLESGGSGTVTIQLYTNLPNAAGVLLASGSAVGTSGSFVDVTWPSVPVSIGTTYYLVFTSTNGGQCIGGDVAGGYANGQLYANPGYGAFPGFDYTFRTATCGGTYTYDPGALSGAVQTVSPAVTTTYTVTGTSPAGCTSTATITVNVNAAPVVNATATPSTTCNLTSVNPCATGAATYVWTGGLSNCTPFVATTTDTYTVTGTDGAGCTGTSSVTVTVNPASGTLAPTTSNQAQDHGDDFNINYYAANCDLIATVDDGAGGNVLGLTTSTVNVDATASFHNGQPFVRRWYQITPTTNGSADVKLYINQTDFDDYNAAVVAPYLPLPTGPGDASGIANIRITKNDDGGLGNNPIVITPAVSWNGTYWELSFNTPSFSQFRVHSVNPGNVPLPVTVTSFSGTKLESSDKLSWITSSEQNNAYFNLQHSTDGISFSTIAKVASKAPNGNSNTALSYTATNNKPALGHNYYRLQQVDIDNKVSVHAQIVDLIWGANGSTVSIYPNPTTDILNIDLYATSAQNTTVKLLDMSGRVIRQVQAKSAVGMNNIQLSLGEIASGVYTVQVYENNHLTHTSKVKKND